MTNAFKKTKSEQPQDREGFVRTGRPYAYDLADYYNSRMSWQASDRGLVWIVVNGEVKLTIDSEYSERAAKLDSERKENERQRWIKNHRSV